MSVDGLQDPRDAEDATRKLDGFKGWVGVVFGKTFSVVVDCPATAQVPRTKSSPESAFLTRSRHPRPQRVEISRAGGPRARPPGGGGGFGGPPPFGGGGGGGYGGGGGGGYGGPPPRRRYANHCLQSAAREMVPLRSKAHLIGMHTRCTTSGRSCE